MNVPTTDETNRTHPVNEAKNYRTDISEPEGPGWQIHVSGTSPDFASSHIVYTWEWGKA